MSSSGGDEGLLGRRGHTPGAGHPVRQRRAEFRRPSGVVVLARCTVQGLQDAAPPGGDREQRDVEVTRPEVERDLDRRVVTVHGDAGRPARRFQGGDRRAGTDVQRDRAHPAATAATSFDVALGAEPAVGRGNGAARDMQVGGHGPGRDEPVTGREPALHDGRAQLLVQLQRLRAWIVRIEEQFHLTVHTPAHLV
jgi:hypothetical protein